MKRYLVPSLICTMALMAGCIEQKKPAQSTIEESAASGASKAPATAPSEAAPAQAAPAQRQAPPPKETVGELAGDKDIKSSEVAYNLALEHAGKREMDIAHHYIDLAIKIEPNSKYSYVKGVFYIGEGYYEQGLAMLDRSMKEGPGTVENKIAVLNAQGVCYKELGKDEEALDKFRQVVNTAGLITRYEAYYNMGIIYMKQQKHFDAEMVLLKVVDENPGFYQAYNKLGMLKGAKGDWPGAALSYQKALEIATQNYATITQDLAELHSNYGEALYMQQMYKEARSELLEALKLMPEGPASGKAKNLLAQLGGV